MSFSQQVKIPYLLELVIYHFLKFLDHDPNGLDWKEINFFVNLS